MSKNTCDTMTGEDHLKLFGFQYAHEFIHVAERNIQEIIAIEKHVIAIDMYNKTLVNDSDNDELKNEKLKKYTMEMNPNLMECSQFDLSQVEIAKRYLAFHCISMAFEMLYKTAIANENTHFERKHLISILHEQLDTSKEEVEGIIIDHGWEQIEDFTSYFDEYFSAPSMKYFESYLRFHQDEKYKHPNQLIQLFHKMSESMRKIASQNRDGSSEKKWTHSIRLLSR